MVGSRPRPWSSPARWIILVARDQSDLYEHLVTAFRGDKQVEVVMDRRTDPRRDSSTVVADLRTRGAVVIRRAVRGKGVADEDSPHR